MKIAEQELAKRNIALENGEHVWKPKVFLRKEFIFLQTQSISAGDKD